MMVADGYDFATLSVAAPAILREWQLQPREMGAVFSITFAGWLADLRRARRSPGTRQLIRPDSVSSDESTLRVMRSRGIPG